MIDLYVGVIRMPFLSVSGNFPRFLRRRSDSLLLSFFFIGKYKFLRNYVTYGEW